MGKLTAYCMKTKEKNVIIENAVITKTKRGGYMVQGQDKNGNKLTSMLSKETAESAIKSGDAKQGW